MKLHIMGRRAPAALVGVVLAATTLTACSGGDAGGGAEEGGAVELDFLIDDGEDTRLQAEALVAAYTEQNPDVSIAIESRPGGSEGDNIVKTRLSTGEMSDVFIYNSGALLQALNPDQTLVNLADEEFAGRLQEVFTTAVSTDNGMYGAPFGGSMAGAMLYNIPLYEELGLEIPETWDDFIANAQAVKEAGTAAPIAQTYSDTWTSQLLVLGDMYNVLADDPEWAEKYTANEAKYVDEPAVAGFEHLEQVNELGLLNEDFASATYEDGVGMVATGEAAHYPILTFAAGVLATTFPENIDDVGLFPIPGEDSFGLTTWAPTGLYIPQTTEGAELEAAKDFLDFIASTEGCDLFNEAASVNGPYVVEGCELPEDAPRLIQDMQPYFDSEDTALALEFLSPVKGPALEQITVEVGSGIRPAADGAALYDEDVKKQALQLGLEGW